MSDKEYVFPCVIYFYRFSYLTLFVICYNFCTSYKHADPGGRAFWGVFLQSVDCWDRVFESPWRLGCLYLLFFVCCVVSGLWDGLITRIECYWVCACDLETSAVGRHGPHWGCCGTEQTRPSAVPVAVCNSTSVWWTQPKSGVCTRIMLGWLAPKCVGKSV